MASRCQSGAPFMEIIPSNRFLSTDEEQDNLSRRTKKVKTGSKEENQEGEEGMLQIREKHQKISFKEAMMGIN